MFCEYFNSKSVQNHLPTVNIFQTRYVLNDV